MALVNEFLNGDSTEGNGPVPGKRQGAIHGLATLFRARYSRTVPLPPGLHALHNEFIKRLEATAPDLFLNQAFRFGLQMEGHCCRLLRPVRAVDSMIAWTAGFGFALVYY